MPSLTFVLPHWLYWTVLALFPLVAIYLVQRQAARPDAGRANHFLAYLFLVTTGFIGMHRFYLKNGWGLVFVPVFLVVLWTSAHVRDVRETVSRTRAESEQAERLVTRAQTDVNRQKQGAAERLKAAEDKAVPARAAFAAAQADLGKAESYARIGAIILGLMLLGDAFLVPSLVRRTRQRESLVPLAIAGPLETALSSIPKVTAAAPGISAIDNLSRVIGEFIAYWAVLAVFAYYYEVIARYVFNSPTNWVHESMFLMFGMQYMLAGAYAYRDETHVRVDIVYSHLSLRGRAICDLITSFFFFIFAGTMLFTGWRFASDAIAVGETSFTEWGIQYWPVKLAIPIGAALLVLQGASRVARDVAVVMRKPV
jgi:TRAP-type mannitol/chloroaromatic compound transport system permease small subunit